MKSIEINNIEEILSMQSDVQTIKIGKTAVIRYIILNKDNQNSLINIPELRNVYAKSINHSYSKCNYKDKITINHSDIKKLCITC